MKEPRKLLLGATPLISLLVFAMFYHAYFFSFIPFNTWMQQWSTNDRVEEQQESIRRLVRGSFRPSLLLVEAGKDRTELEATGLACDSALHSLVCVSTEPVRIETKSMTVHVPSSGQTKTMAKAEPVYVVQPYALREDKGLMKYISPVHVVHHNITLTHLPCQCTHNHNVPAIVFSTGLTGNIFHEFNDIIIPLFITSRHFQSRVRFVVFDYNPPFIKKFRHVFSLLSSYEVLNQASDGSVHCFPGVVVGLKYHDNLALNSSQIPGGRSMLEFKQFLREAFNLKVKNVKQIKKPVLVLISRRKTRVILNQNELVGMMKELGFRVIVTEVDLMKNLEKFARVVNSCNVMVGAHGAGLTNELFLPAGAVMIQMVLLGLTWASDNYYGDPAQQMGVKYLQYKIEPNESSLIDQFEPNDPVIDNPESMLSRGYQVARALYIDHQNVTINLSRFKPTLVQALGYLRRSNSIH